IAAGVAIGQLFVIEAQQVEHRGVKVMNMHRVLDSFVAEFIRGAVNVTPLYAASSEPNGESVMIMIAPFTFARRAGGGNLHCGSPPKSPAANHKCFGKQAALLQIRQQS